MDSKRTYAEALRAAAAVLDEAADIEEISEALEEEVQPEEVQPEAVQPEAVQPEAVKTIEAVGATDARAATVSDETKAAAATEATKKANAKQSDFNTRLAEALKLLKKGDN